MEVWRGGRWWREEMKGPIGLGSKVEKVFT